MKQARAVLRVAFCLTVGMKCVLLLGNSIPNTLDDLAIKLQDQLRRAGDSVRSRNEKLKDRVALKINTFGESIEKEDVSEKIDTKLLAVQEDIQGQFNRFRVQLGSLVPSAKERNKVEKKLDALENKVSSKVSSLASNVKNQSSRVLKNIRKRASRLSDQVVSVLDVNRDRPSKNNRDIVATAAEEKSVPVCGVADNAAVSAEETATAS